MDDKEKREIALFRFSLIAPLVNETYGTASKNEFYRLMASKEHILPSGAAVRLSSDTIKKWYLGYKNGGFDTLIPKSRSDAGKPRNIDSNAIKKILELKESLPYITGTLIYHKLVEEGYIKSSRASLATVLRYIRENNLKRSQLTPVDRRAYEMEFSNDCWQADTSHGPVITVNGQKRKTYLITFIDDASRLILHGEFFFQDNSVSMQTVFKKAIFKYGVPKRIFVDNGGTYKNDQLRLICASLGIILIHTRAYAPESKGKIERVFRTIKDNWMNGINWNEYSSLEALNVDFNRYLNEKYSNSIHSSLSITPRDRFIQDMSRIKFLSPEEIDVHFLHRVSRRVNNDATISLNSLHFEVPAKYMGQKINIRYSPITLDTAFIFDKDNKLSETIYPLKRVDNSKIKRNVIDYSKMTGGDLNV